MSFGFSVGDFLAGAKLIADLTRMLSASKGASMEYQQLILDLGVVETTLIQIDQMRLASQLNHSAVNALAWIVKSTAASISEFLRRTKKYQESLSTNGSGKRVKDLWNKIGWSMYKPAEIRSLQQRLQLDLGAINCLISLAICNKSSLETYYDEIDAGSLAQLRRAELPSYRDEDFRVIVHRRISHNFIVGASRTTFDPTYQQPRDPHSFYRIGQAFALLLPKQRQYANTEQNATGSKRTLYLSYQLPNSRVEDKGKLSTALPSKSDALLSTILTSGDIVDGNSNNTQNYKDTYESNERNTYIGEANIRRFVVVREGIYSALCLPIQTFNGRGCIDQVGQEAFGIIHTTTIAPNPMAGEERMGQIPIHLQPAHPADSLHNSSRINYRKLYRVDHNVRVRDLGLVNVNCIQTLVASFEQSCIKITEDLKFEISSGAQDERVSQQTHPGQSTAESIISQSSNTSLVCDSDKRNRIPEQTNSISDSFDERSNIENPEDLVECMFEFET